MLQLLFWSFVVVSSICSIYYLCFLSFASAKQKQLKPFNLPVSVIVCAKNEAQNLKHLIPKLLEQSYLNFELVLINDASFDDTLSVMEYFETKHNHIKVVNVESNETFWGNKKYALTLGIKASSHDHLLFIDADCEPVSKHWIQLIANNFTEKKTIVLGYGGYKKVKHSLLNALVRYETLLTAIQYFSYSKLGNPYMGVGRNLAYNKSEFYNVNGFIDHMHLKSGDDDLFVNQVANSKNTTINFSRESHTLSNPPNSFSEWIKQKRRHISTASHYNVLDRVLLGVFYSSRISFYTLFVILICYYSTCQMVLLLFTLVIAIQFITFGKSAKKLNETNLIYFLPFLDIFLILFQLVIFIINCVSKPVHWK